MNAKQKLHQAHLQEWAARFADQKASGLTVKQWCEQNHFSIHTYNYWKHLLKEEVIDQLLPNIVPVTVPVASDTVLPSVPTTHLTPQTSPGTSAPSPPDWNAHTHIESPDPTAPEKTPHP